MEPKDDAQAPARVLIVDDAMSVSVLLGMKLEREGYKFAIARSTAEATQRLEVEEFDLILLDIKLPDGSGLDLLKRLRQQRSLLDIPIIMLSGFDQTNDVVTALRDGANDYITKPFDLAVVLARIRTQLAVKQLKEANERFLQIVSHDLKKPLFVILDAARQLRADCPPGQIMTEDARAALSAVIESAEFMQLIIADLLELRAMRDRRLRIEKLPTDLGATVRQAVARNTRYAQTKRGEVRMEFGRDLPNILADDLRLMQVLENLIGNAIKFAPPGGVVTVRTLRDGAWVVCEVSDTGPGIPTGEMELLFKQYGRTANEPTGGESSTGLGLAICRELIALHGGEIGVRNNLDRGATFWFRIPIS